jgi:hypothetical protein
MPGAIVVVVVVVDTLILKMYSLEMVGVGVKTLFAVLYIGTREKSRRLRLYGMTLLNCI